jgi:hypothetical protein
MVAAQSRPALDPPRPPPSPTPSTNALTGTLAPELGAKWPQMEDLSLQRNQFTGPLPAQWASMGNLKRLLLQ